MKGKLIVIEGTDGSGKETQFDRLVKRLEDNNIDFKTLDFPRYDSHYGKIIAKYLNGELGALNEVDPYFIAKTYALDRLELRDDMETWLKEGKLILCNRYVDSNKAHQGAKIANREEREKFIGWVDNLEYNINRIPRPDLTIFLYVPYETAQLLIEKKGKRDYTKKKKDIHENAVDYLEKTENVYLELSKKENRNKIDCVDNGNLLSIKTIHEKIWKELKGLL